MYEKETIQGIFTMKFATAKTTGKQTKSSFSSGLLENLATYFCHHGL